MADSTRKTSNFLPTYFQTEKNKKFLSSTIDQLINVPQLERINGFIGSKISRNYNAETDIYLPESDYHRKYYQFEPSAVFRNSTGDINDVVTYDDLIHKIESKHIKSDHLDNLFRCSFYSYDPFIDWDKLINFDQYYWLINGPESIILDNLDVENTILGKTSYELPNDVILSNGMKLKFGDNVFPISYRGKEYIVEGVGTSIELLDFSELVIYESIGKVYDELFDSDAFDSVPFDGDKRIPLDPEYVTINKASKDKNPWSRYNRWFHKDVVVKTAQANGIEGYILPDNTLRAKRPIIEFKANIQLNNFGNVGIGFVDLIDTDTADAFNIVQNSLGYYVDGIQLEKGHKVIFNADRDSAVRSKIYEVDQVLVNGNLRLQLTEVVDSQDNNSISVKYGTTNFGTSWKYNAISSTWIKAQQHVKLNEGPLFDLFDKDNESYSEKEFTNFSGNKIFGYDTGNQFDEVLGLNVNISNTAGLGSYIFRNFFMTETINFSQNNKTIEVKTADTFFKYNDNLKNVWREIVDYQLPIIEIQTTETTTSTLTLQSIDAPIDLTNFNVRAYNSKNNEPLVIATSATTQVVDVSFDNELSVNDTVIFKINSVKPPNQNGYWEIPKSLTNNPLNGPISTFTLSVLTEHLYSMAERIPNFQGKVQGENNLRDLPDYGKYGTRLIINADPLSFTQVFLGKKEHDVISALEWGATQYDEFKLSFLNYLDKVDSQLSPRDAVDFILSELTKNKDDRSPFFYSDMLGYGTDKITKEFTITSSIINEYPVGANFDLSTNSYEAIYIYKNNNQLLHGVDYTFNKIDGTVIFLTSLALNDKIIIDYYSNTKGCFVPLTPSKMAIFASTNPNIYTDFSYATPTNVILGHDNSIIKAFNDYRDTIVLEYELRIHNNLKVNLNTKVFDILGVTTGYFADTHISRQEYIDIFNEYVLGWAGKYNIDLFTNNVYDPLNYKTWNYKNCIDVFGNTLKNSSLNYILRWFFGTSTPNFTPWQMLGLAGKPSWWDEEYGPAPYTSGNIKLWNDLEQGYIRGEDRIGVDRRRPGLSQIIPVDEYGDLKSPFDYLLTENTLRDRQLNWEVDALGPAELSFRRSSIYPFIRTIIAVLWDPSTFLSRQFDLSRITFNSLDQIVYGTNIYLNPKDLIIDRTNTPICGYGAIVLEKGLSIDRNYDQKLKDDLNYLTFNIVHKVGGFVNKEKLQITIDSVDPTSLGIGAILPQEDYDLILNVSDPLQFYSASGIIVQKYNGKFVVKGYDIYRPYFEVLVPYINNNSRTITVGGKPESFTEWTSIVNNSNPAVSSIDLTTAESITSRYYRQGQIVRYNNRFYRVKTSHNATTKFEPSLFAELNELPTRGGVTVQRPISFDQHNVVEIPYGTEFSTIQEVYNFIIGYGERLKKLGFIFDDFNNEFNEILDWNFSAKEFLYWCTQNWADGHLITLSPFANQIQFRNDTAIVDNISSDYTNLHLLRADGRILTKENYSISRDEKLCTIKSKNPNEGMFFVNLNLVQKEHTLVFNNKTIFNDVVYDIETGLKQQRAKLYGFRTKNWNGDFFSPGFVFDNIKIKDWESYTTYLPSEIVRFNGEFYSATKKITPEATFDFNKWTKLLEKPTSELLPNFEYKINQFEDFYSLDIDNFDYDQQSLAQHLIGYTERSYLTDIFSNPISQYKFYQGFIRDKGTVNAIERLNKASVFNLQGDLKIAEQWAFRIGDYGSFSSLNELEFNLIENTQIDNNYIVKLVDSLPTNTNPNLTYVESNDLIIKPDDYSSTTAFVTYNTSYDDSGFLLSDAGYVKDDEVTATAYNKISLLDIANNNLLNEGDVIWLGYLENGGWDIYRYSKRSAQITGVYVSAPGETITFVTNRHHGLKIGDIVSVVNFDNQVNGIHIIVSLPSLNQFTVASSLTTIIDNDLVSYGLLYKFESIRFSNFANLANKINQFEFEETNKIYIDSNDNNKWAVYEKLNNYSDGTFIQPVNDNFNQLFGSAIYASDTTSTVLISAPGWKLPSSNSFGKIFVYRKVGTSLNKDFEYTLNSPTNYCSTSKETDLGYSLSYDISKDLFIIGSPAASQIISSTATNTVVLTTGTGVVKTFDREGLVKISTRNTNSNAEIVQAVLVSPFAATSATAHNARFGHAIYVNQVNKQSTTTMLVSAPGTGTGRVYAFGINTSTVGIDITSHWNGIEIISTNSVTLSSGSGWGSSIVGNQDGSLIAISAPYYETSSTTGLIQIFDKNHDWIQTIYAPYNTGEVFGYDLEMSNTGSFLFITSKDVKGTNLSYGKTYVYKLDGSLNSIDIVNTHVSSGDVEVYISDPDLSTGRKATAIAIKNGNAVSSVEIIDPGFGYTKPPTVAFSGTGVIIAGSINASVNSFYRFNQELENPIYATDMRFGERVSLSADASTLSISALGTNKTKFNEFDVEGETSTTFDNASTKFYDSVVDSGTVFVYQRFGDYFVLAEELNTAEILSGSKYGISVLSNNNVTYVGATSSGGGGIAELTTATYYTTASSESLFVEFSAPDLDNGIYPSAQVNYKSLGATKTIESIQILYSGRGYINVPTVLLKDAYGNTVDTLQVSMIDEQSRLYQFNKIDSNFVGWKKLREQESLVDINKFKRLALIDTESEEIVDYLDIIDPLKGKIAGPAERELKYKATFDPAIYSIAISPLTIDNNNSWLDEHVGELWWDLSNAKFKIYEQGDDVYRKNTWGQLFPGSTIDVYEWVRSNLLPSEWAAQADTNEGLTLGISGQPKYPNNSVISVKQVLNPVTNSFENVYYYWVKNKVTVPETSNRKISAFETARLIADPEAMGYKFAQILSKDSLSLINVKDSIVADKININITYDKLDNIIPRHTEWLLLEEDNPRSVPSILLEKKLFDSLLGRDSQGNLVPDPNLIERNRYGLGIRPQQTIFKDRIEALRNLIEYTNGVLLSNRITGAFDLSRLQTKEQIPNIEDGEYDGIVEDLVELGFIDTIGLRPASATCSVSNGKIVGVTITDPGFGYKLPPKITIETNIESSASIKTIIDAQGRVIDYIIEDAGNRFETAPVLKIRPHSYIVQANEDYAGRWTLHEFNYLQNEWIRVRTQAFNTELYWNYVDWISPDYNDSKNINYTISGIYELATLENIIPGDYVKIRNGGDSRFIILERLEPNAIGNFTLGYNIVYSENGTIQISNSIWDIANSNFGYDVLTLEETLFDQVPDVELSNILQALRYDIFIKNLKVYWNKFFFVAVKYALSEQKLLDWAFKTSLISVVNDAGNLNQISVYKFNKAENYESYLREVKPYHTQLKDYTSKHSTLDTYNGSITDFDLPFYYNSNTDLFESISINDDISDEIPYIYWKNNYKYGVERISIDNPGRGYTQVPTLVVTTATGDTGSGLKGQIYIKNGGVSDIVITDSGEGYILPPIITIVGGGSSITSTATASAILGLNPIRKNKIEIKFDRYTRTNVIGSTATTDIFTCTGLVNEFQLTWYADTDKINITPTLDGRLIYADDYEIIQSVEVLPGYHKKISKFKFLNEVPSNGQIFKITYNKNTDLYNAIDRIDRFYNPDDGMLGKSYPQLMRGMEYPKTQIVGLGLNYLLPWTTSTQSLYGTSSYGEIIEDHITVKLTNTATIGTTTLYLSTTTGIQPGYIINILNSTTNRIRTDTAVVAVGANSVTISAPDYRIKTIKSNGVSTGSQITVKTMEPFYGQIVTGDIVKLENVVTSGYNNLYTVDKVSNNNTFIVTATQTLSSTTGAVVAQSNVTLCNVFTNIDVKNELLETWEREISNTATFFLDTYLYIDDIRRAEVNVNGVPAVNAPAFIPWYEIIESTTTAKRAIIRLESLTATIVNTVTFAVYGDPAVEFYKFNNNYSAVDTNLIGGSYTSTGLIGALGVNPEEIIIDGDKFLSENASYAPEEMVPGQVVDSLGINVYTKQNIGYPLIVTGSFPVLNTNTQNDVTLGVEIGNFAGILINLNGQIFERVTSTNFVESNEFYISGNTIIMPPQPVTGRAGYTLVSVGSDNLIDGNQTSEVSTSLAVTSLVSIDDVASVFVLVNGKPVSNVPSTSTIYYSLESENQESNRASVKVFNMQNRLNHLQAWFFNAEFPEFNRINEELITIGGTPQSSFVLSNPPFQAEPSSAHAIVEIYDSNNPGNVTRLLPPWVSYYQAETGVNIFAIDNKNIRSPGTFNITNVLAYVNGKRLRPSFDFTVNSTNSTVIINPGLVASGDAVAVMGITDYDYYIDNGVLKLDTAVSDSVIKIITFFDHDNLFMRTERFNGNISKRFTLSRRVLDDNHVWVTVNGIPLTSRYDYKIMDDFRSVQLSDWVPLTESDDVVIISFGAPEFETYVVGWRYFKDIFDRTHYRRLAKYNTTELTRQLKAADTEIHVVDSTRLGSPNPARNKPGVIIVDGERIEFFKKSGNVLTNLRRSTLGTGPALVSDIGTKVIDQSNINTIQYSDITLIQNIQTTLTTTYVINTLTDQTTYGDGIVLNTNLPAIDQLIVYYGGRQLRKSSIQVHDMTVSFDTTTNSLSTLNPEFTINTLTNEIVLNIADGIEENVRLTFVQRKGYVWTGTESILTSNVSQAVYLRDKQAELPDIYYYGGDPVLTDIDSFAITEEDGDPLEGF